MIILAHDRRKIVRTAVTEHPTAVWLSRQITEAFPWDTAPLYLLRDRDASYGSYFCNRVEAMGIKQVVTASRSPWQNAYVERVIGSIRRECLDHIVIFNERHLRRVLSWYAMNLTVEAPMATNISAWDNHLWSNRLLELSGSTSAPDRAVARAILGR